MKQKIALILAALAVFCSCGPSHKLEETDNVFSKMDDIRFITYCQSFFDANKDFVLSMEEAAAVDAINIPAQYMVSSLKGIEYFTNLSTLSCARNPVKSIDISGNAALAELYCRDNDLSSLDMSKNKALKEMECQRNRLSSLDLSGNVELVSLDCSDNRLSELDISKTLLFMTEYKNLVEEILEWQKMDCLYQKVPMTLYMNQSQYDRIYEEHGDTLKMLNINAVVR